MKALVIDAFEFCRLKERRAGECAISDLARLAEETVDKFGSLTWVLQGGVDGMGYPRLQLEISGMVEVSCQRCLTPLSLDISSTSNLILATDDGGADEIEALMADDDTVDVIVGSKALDVLALIEDEALLSIPLAPKHQVCPGQRAAGEAGTAQRPSPFAVLKNLK